MENNDRATSLANSITELRYLEIARKGPDGWKAYWGMDGPVQEYVPSILPEAVADDRSPD